MIDDMIESATASRVPLVQIMDSIGPDRGGLTKAVLKRFRNLSKNRRSILVTVAYQPNVRAIFENLKSAGEIPMHAELASFHESQGLATPSGPPLEKVSDQWRKDPACVSVVESPTITRYYRSGAFVGLEGFDAGGHLKFIDVHSNDRPWVRTHRDDYSVTGSLQMRQYFDDEGRVRFRSYVSQNGHPYLSVWVNENGFEYRGVDFTESRAETVAGARGANTLWLRRFLADLGPSVVFTDEPRTSFALKVAADSIAHVVSIHTTHVANNRNHEDGLKQWTSHLIADKKNIQRLVSFTEAQRRDLVEDFGMSEDRVACAPHAVTGNLGEGDQPAVEPKLFVVVSRLAPDKRIDHILRAFAIAMRSDSALMLEICGVGPELSNLKKLSSELGIGDRVVFTGYVTEPLRSLAKATASVIASKYEGFGLVILESMKVGTPVIGYDVMYGPHDLIEDGVNGCLVADGDIEGLANAIVGFGDPSIRQEMSHGCVKTADRYSQKTWDSAWTDILVDAEESLS